MNKVIFFLSVLVTLHLSAKEINFFDSEIDFWDSTKKTATNNKAQDKPQDVKFPWKDYLDPKNKEFFKEGDYTPPEPFMEVARNPTNENLKNWFELMQKKNEIQTRLQKRMAEYMALQQKDIIPEEPKLKGPKSPSYSRPVDPTRFRFRMFFDSQCPHCKKMFLTLEHFQKKGFAVEALQVDTKTFDASFTTVNIVKASAEDLKKNKIESVPFVLIADTLKKILLPPITGYHDYNEVNQMLLEISQK